VRLGNEFQQGGGLRGAVPLERPTKRAGSCRGDAETWAYVKGLLVPNRLPTGIQSTKRIQQLSFYIFTLPLRATKLPILPRYVPWTLNNIFGW